VRCLFARFQPGPRRAGDFAAGADVLWSSPQPL